MKLSFILFILVILILPHTLKAEKTKTSETHEIATRIYLDSLSKLNNKLNVLQEKLNNLNTDYQSNLKFINFINNNAENRIGWVIGIISIVFSIIVLGGSILIYFNTIQPAREILENFDQKVDLKYQEREDKEVIERINLAFEYMKTDEYKINEHTKLIFENLPYPFKETYKEEILRNIFYGNANPTCFIAFFRIIEKHFFKENSDNNDKFAKYLLNNDSPLKNEVINYFSQYHTDSKKIIKILFPVIIKWKETVWVYHRQLCLEKFDDFFRHLEGEKLLLETYTNYIKYLKTWEHYDVKGKKIETTTDYYRQFIQDEILKINPNNRNSYGYIKYIELFTNNFDRIINEV